MIEVQNLNFSYPGASSKVFDGFQLKLESGHTYGLLGRNGTGKSTLLYLASGLLRPKKGHLYIDGMESAQRDPLMLSRIFLVPEEFRCPRCRFKNTSRSSVPSTPASTSRCSTTASRPSNCPTSATCASFRWVRRKRYL